MNTQKVPHKINFKKNMFYLRRSRILDVALNYTGLEFKELRSTRDGKRVRNVIIYLMYFGGIHPLDIYPTLKISPATMYYQIRNFHQWKDGTKFQFEVELVKRLKIEIEKEETDLSLY